MLLSFIEKYAQRNKRHNVIIHLARTMVVTGTGHRHGRAAPHPFLRRPVDHLFGSFLTLGFVTVEVVPQSFQSVAI